VTVLNAGRDGNGALKRGSSVGYSARRVGDAWAVDCMEIIDL
jgi:hypothetical protein